MFFYGSNQLYAAAGAIAKKKNLNRPVGKKNPKKQTKLVNKQTNKTLNRQGVPNYLDYSMA